MIMSTLDESLQLGMKVFERLRPALQSLQPRRKPASGSLSAGVGSNPEAAVLTSIHASPPDSLPSIFEQMQLSPFSVILGMGQDNVPFTLDLTIPSPGAVLICGDRQCGKSRLLRSILASAASLNTPEQVVFGMIAADPQELLGLSGLKNCRLAASANDPSAWEWIKELASLAEERRQGGFYEPVHILAIDDLPACLEALDEEAYTRLYWLVRHGPRLGVWTLASLESAELTSVDPRFLSGFRTPIIGHVEDDQVASYLTGHARSGADQLESGKQFIVPFGAEWLPLWVNEEATP
jgi:hypothetical protein